MASESIPSPVPAPLPGSQVQPLQAWLGRLGLSGKLLAIGGLVGVIAVFLPLVSMSVQMPTGGSLLGGKGAINLPAVSTTLMVVQDFRGVICLLGYLAALAFAFVLYPPNGLGQKALGWAGAGVGGLIALLALWLLLGTLSGSGSLFGMSISVGFGAILNLLAAAAVTAGGVLKAREEKLF